MVSALSGISRLTRRRLLPSADWFERRLCEQSFMNFIRWAWPIIEAATVFTETWHIELIAEYLEAVTAGQIKRLLINCPPRHMKSISVSVCWPVWNWCRSPADKLGPEDILSGPQSRWIFASYADELSTKHSVDRRTIMESAQYKAFW